MSRLPILLKKRAIKLRKRGFSIREIISVTGIAQGTASAWFRDIQLSKPAQARLIERIYKGRYIAAENKKKKTKFLKQTLLKKALEEVSKTNLNTDHQRILCAMIYWCEGAKNDSYVQFTNSDPKLVNLFIKLLVKTFNASRDKFKVRLHLHSYHNPKKQHEFWQQELNLKSCQFYKPYLKINSGKNIREGYPGCVAVTYFDTMLARRLLSLAGAYMGV